MAQVNIPWGGSEKEGTRRVVELDLIKNRKALSLVRRKHLADEHPGSEKFAGLEIGCQTCTDIALRMLRLTQELD